ncbi:AraC family transcriptional regulator [Stenotrophomonas sp. Sa5BUN4]|uniref:AraC family transcriptional regulator n=1 Tax=Stenotrophomonas lacuserhaii TaxID=2760084 RepID=A0A8X8K1D4_9GAMM|nr:helix-turn-helix domain-containing protein [Stenotrophomonas pennii]MBD7952840.1 AraC family transcriptional regulator [Stenotrophomonas pennii]
MADGVGSESTDGLRPMDLATLGNVLRVCEVELVLLDGNGPRAAVDARVQDEALFCHAVTGFQARGRFMLPTDWALLGYVHASDPALSWCHGVPLTAGTVLTVLPDGISEFALGAGTRLTLVMVSAARLQRKLAELSLRSMPPSGQALNLFSMAEHSPLASHYRQLQDALAAGDTAAMAAEGSERLLHEHVQALLAAGPGEQAMNTRARRTHYLIVQRAENFMRLNLRRNIYMNEICDAAGVSERGLRYAFEDLFGISPNRYLSMLRLCAACRGLSMADGGRRSVKSIALSCGLWDLSRFADNYRKVFGELPRDTLMRAPGAPGIVGQPA